MSDGGGESGKQYEQQNTKRKSGGDDFGRATAKIAVAQICESAGFQSFQQSALETLSDVAVRYIQHLGKTVHFHANLAGRTECNAFDIIQGLEDFGSAQGFSGASDINHCLSSSGTVWEINQYVCDSEEIPFAYDIPHFPVVRDRNPTPSFLQNREVPPGEHIPAWLPAFPDPHTYIHPAMSNERAIYDSKDRLEQEREHKKEERLLLNFQQRLTCNGSEGPSSVDPGDAAKAKRSSESNPFLSKPLQFGEKEVSPIVPPARLANETILENHVENRVLELETFAPAIEAMKSRICESEDEGKKVILNKRPAVQFKIGIGKKSLGTAMDFRLQNKCVQKMSSCLPKETDKDDKKGRAEQILKESMDNPEELAQL